jgi:endo-1,4-beta-xylanase
MLRRKFALMSALALLLGAMSAAAVAAPAQALPVIPVFDSGHVFNGDSPRCLDSGTPTHAQLWTCSTSVFQQWTHRADFGAEPIVGNSPTGCLDEAGTTNGSGAFLNTCNGSLSQKWIYDGGLSTIVNAASGLCLDADLGTIGAGGTKVQVWSCSGGSNQKWEFENQPS